MELMSPAFAQGGEIPRKHTGDGENVSPPLRWRNAPDTAHSFLIVCDDPDAPSGTFHHWAAFDIPSNWRELGEGHGAESVGDGFRQAINGFGKPGYSGPLPPEGDRPHHYHFRVSALGIDELPVASTASCEEVIEASQPYLLDFIELIGVYGR